MAFSASWSPVLDQREAARPPAEIAFPMQPGSCERGMRGAEHGQQVVIPGLQNRLQVGLARFRPRSTIHRIVHRAQERVQP